MKRLTKIKCENYVISTSITDIAEIFSVSFNHSNSIDNELCIMNEILIENTNNFQSNFTRGTPIKHYMYVYISNLNVY